MKICGSELFPALVLSALLPFFSVGCASSPSTGGTTTPVTIVTPAVTPATVTSIAPAILPVGSAATVITVTGTNFLSSSIVQVAGVSQPSTFVSSTSMQATVPPSLLAVASLLPIAVLNGTTTSATGAAVNLELDNPAPVVSSFFPTALFSGVTGVPLVVAGTGFVPTSSAQVGGSPRPTTYVSPTQLSVGLSVADVATAGSLSLKVVNPGPGGGTSADSSIPVNNPVPAGLILTPSTGIVGAAAATINVAGTGFYPGSVVKVNGVARTTLFVDITHVTFQLTAADQIAVAILAISVTNPPAGGGTSAPVSLIVSLPTLTPVITSVSPTQFIVNSGASTVFVSGSGFTSRSVVQWNGTALSTSYSTNFNNGGLVIGLFASVPASLLSAIGTASVTVMSPTATPATSNAASITIANPPAPTITSITPNFGPMGVATPIAIFGGNFTTSSVISFNGTNLTTTYGSQGNITATIPASAIATPGNSSITVTTPAPGGGTTASLAFTSYVPIVNNSGIYNPANGLYYVSVPSSVGAPYGNSVVSVDPATGAFGTPIAVGSEPNKLALSSDGTILWVGLDGAGAVRQVNLATGVAGQQFTVGTNSGFNYGIMTALALAALPGAPNSVVVSISNSYNTPSVGIYDSGVLRGASSSTGSYSNNGVALQVDGSKQEIYSANSNGYFVFTYNSSGVTAKTSVTTSSYANNDDLQITSGKAYTDLGKVYDAESGSLLGTFYSGGTVVATGPTIVDPTLAKAFILDYPNQNSYTYKQIQVFNTSDYTAAATSVIPLNGLTSYSGGSASHLTRWGTNGLVLRTSIGVFSVRSNLVKDLSTTVADLGITIAASGGTTTGSTATYTATVKNAGPAGATNISFTGVIPSSAILSSITTTQGSCALATTVSCNLGALANGASATINVVLTLATSGTTTFSGQVNASETDSNLADNQASSAITVTGTAYSPAPTITALTPAAVQAGASDTAIAIAGTNFNSSTVASLNGTALTTTVTSTVLLSAIVPAANLTTLGWGAITVATPTPGGGVSAALPLSVFSVVTLGVNHIVYDPFSRKLYASLGSGSSSVTGNSIATITPETGAIGTPIAIGSQPTALALSSSGQTLYVSLKGSNSIARFNMTTQQADGPYSILPANGSAVAPATMDVQPGSETAVAFEQPSFTVYDFNTTTKTASPRTVTGGFYYSNSSPRFLNATTLYGFSNSGLERYDVSPTSLVSGYQSPYISSLNRFGPFKIDRGLAFANAGGVVDLTTSPVTQLGYYPSLGPYYYNYNQIVAPDTSLGRVFFLASTSANSPYTVDGVVAYNQTTFLPTGILPLNMAVVEGNSSYTGVDLVRWGQDGLAVLTSGGHLYLVRGPAVVPQLLNQNTAATLSSATPGNVTHGTGNTILSVIGSGFIQGAATTWNGSYRTTTWIDSSHLTVAIPASDLFAAGTATLVVTNPSASASGSVTFTVN